MRGGGPGDRGTEGRGQPAGPGRRGLRWRLAAVFLCAAFHLSPRPTVLAQESRSDSVGRLWNPAVVQQRDPTTARDDDSSVKWIEHRIRCTCGCNLDVFTCRTTDFTCATSPAMHRLVLARLDSAMTAPQVVAAFEAQYGQMILMAPPRRGFNWTAYLMPFVGLGLGLGIVVALMRRWVRGRPREPVGTEPPPPAAPGGATPGELERLKRELDRFES